MGNTWGCGIWIPLQIGLITADLINYVSIGTRYQNWIRLVPSLVIDIQMLYFSTLWAQQSVHYPRKAAEVSAPPGDGGGMTVDSALFWRVVGQKVLKRNWPRCFVSAFVSMFSDTSVSADVSASSDTQNVTGAKIQMMGRRKNKEHTVHVTEWHTGMSCTVVDQLSFIYDQIVR